MRVTNKLNSYSRGLLIVLCIVLTIVLTDCKIVYGYSTTDDLKSYLGIAVEKHDEEYEYRADISEVMIKNENELEKKEEQASEIDIQKQNLSLIGIKIEQLMKQDASGFKIINYINEAKNIKNNIQSLMYSIETDSVSDVDITKDDVEIYESCNDINSRWFNIGDLGDNLKYMVTPFTIYEPYGYEIEYTDRCKGKYNVISNKNSSLKISNTNVTEIKNIFNGEVFSIDKQSICINHGNGVFTVISGIRTYEFNRKDTVKQYETIGVPDHKLKYIEISLIVDNKYVNPLLIFGNNGKHKLDNFYKSTGREYVVEKGEHRYYDEDISIINPNIR